VNLAARLCAEAKNGEILIDGKVQLEVENEAGTEFAGDLSCGFHRPVRVFNVRHLH
jgi:class 3 adenylate cyclase